MAEAVCVLAAGVGSRYKGPTPKLRSIFRGKELVRWSLEAALAAPADFHFVVIGGTEIRDLIPAGFEVLENDRYQSGMASSVMVAIDQARSRGLNAITIGLGDQPGIGALCWTSVCVSRSSPIAVATYDGKRRNPVRLADSVWGLLPTEGDLGARELISSHPDLVTEVACDGEPFDIDTLEDFEIWS